MPFFRAAWEKYVSPIASRIDFEKAHDGFRTAIESIFEGIQIREWGPQPFYPSHFRNLILEAGASRKIMKMTYDDRHERLVEPYALSYKRKKDGEAAEYFYVWDLTGGGSEPGLKTFFHHRIKNLAIAEQTYEPRYPVELSKAGEYGANRYFGKPFSHKTRASRAMSEIGFLRQPASSSGVQGARLKSGRSRSTGLGWGLRQPARSAYASIYKVECPYCQKRFTRSRPDTVLNPHKDPNGYPCSGRTGYLI
jgi:hypothetical protein